MISRVCFSVCTQSSFESVTKVGLRWVDWNLISNSLSGFRVSSYNCTAYRCSQFWITKACKMWDGVQWIKIRYRSTQRGPTLTSWDHMLFEGRMKAKIEPTINNIHKKLACGICQVFHSLTDNTINFSTWFLHTDHAWPICTGLCWITFDLSCTIVASKLVSPVGKCEGAVPVPPHNSMSLVANVLSANTILFGQNTFCLNGDLSCTINLVFRAHAYKKWQAGQKWPPSREWWVVQNTTELPKVCFPL